eukprot:747364-Hanusia_phi.AAC.10
MHLSWKLPKPASSSAPSTSSGRRWLQHGQQSERERIRQGDSVTSHRHRLRQLHSDGCAPRHEQSFSGYAQWRQKLLPRSIVAFLTCIANISVIVIKA